MGRHALILAGGCGRRLWPYSRMAAPKQFLEFGQGASLFRQAWERARDVVGEAGIWVVLRPENVDLAQEQVPELDMSRVFIEPVPRGTAAAAAFGVHCIGMQDSRALIWLVPSDHFVGGREEFLNIASLGFQAADQYEGVVLVGIEPKRPETQYGYIKAGGRWGADTPFLHVARFSEKPDGQTAARYLEEGGWFWNSGMFFFSCASFEAVMSRHVPQVMERVRGMGCTSSWQELALEYKELPPASLDRLLIEKMENLIFLPAAVEWEDLGLWRTHYSRWPKDKDGNAVSGEVMAKGCYGCLMFAGPGHMIGAIGLHNVAVIVHDGAVLVCSMESLDEVGDVVMELEDGKGGKFL